MAGGRLTLECHPACAEYGPIGGARGGLQCRWEGHVESRAPRPAVSYGLLDLSIGDGATTYTGGNTFRLFAGWNENTVRRA